MTAAAAVESIVSAANAVDANDWSTFAEDPKSHQICALCSLGADTDRPLLDAYLGSGGFKAHRDCALTWAKRQHGPKVLF